jgi:GT2 family glycosyltransferase
LGISSRPAGSVSAPGPARAWQVSTGKAVAAATVIIVNYNGRGEVERCLASLLDDPFCRRQCEIIVVDNASSDGSAECVEQDYPDVRLVRSGANLGFGSANNLGARQATGRFLAFLNPDVTVAPGWLEPLIAALEADPCAGLATSQILLLGDPRCINTCGNQMHYTGLTLCRGLGEAKGSYSHTEEVTAVSGAAFAVRREVFLELGGFDDNFFMYMEDADLSWRARLAGYRCLYVPGSVIYHDYALHFGARKTFYEERNRYQMLLKVLDRRTLLLLLPALLLAEVVTWGFALLRDRAHLLNKPQAYAWVIHRRQAIRAGRREAQALRRARDRDLLGTCTHRLAFEQTGAGPAAWLAHLVFDPLFFAWQRLALSLMRW